MTIKKIVQASALSILLIAGSAAAQVAGSVNAVANPTANPVLSGTQVFLGTVTLTGVNGGASVSSIPLTITASNGGATGNLSSCQLYNSGGVSLTTGGNVINSVNSGAVNMFNLNNVLALNGTGAMTTLTVRCDVATASQSGSVFTIAASSAVQGPALWVNLDVAPSVPAGSGDVALANISLGAANANYNVTSIPLTITSSANGSIVNLSDCKIRDASNLDGAVTAVTAITAGSATMFNLTSPLSVPAGTANMLSLSCDVQSTAAVGSTYSISVIPGNVVAKNAATGLSITPIGIAAGAYGPNGLPASTSGTLIVSAAGSTPVPPVTDPDTTPGVPNTGLGNNIMLLGSLLLAGLIALMGAFYLGRKQA